MDLRGAEESDFRRMLASVLSRGLTRAAQACAQVQSEFSARGMFGNSRTAFELERRVAVNHEETLLEAMRLVMDFAERTGISITQLSALAREPIASFSESIVEELQGQATEAACGRSSAGTFKTVGERFSREVDAALQNVELGFVGQRSVNVSSVQEEALRLLRAVYDYLRRLERCKVILCLWPTSSLRLRVRQRKSTSSRS